MADHLRTSLERSFGPVEALTALTGGDTHRAFRVVLAGGERLFAKWSATAHPFEAEAAGLRAIRASGTPLIAPEPLSFDAHHLVLSWLEPGPPSPDEDLGRGLAMLHRHSHASYGFAVDGSCGATPQRNPWTESWPAFYAEHRLQPMFRALSLMASEAKAADRLLQRLPQLLANDEPPALIHGDLWSGNHLHTAGGHALVDPAAAFCHREAELGMMTLFGGFGPRVYEAYRGAWPLAPGWEDRVALYRLYHLLNHAVLFGGGYRQQAFETVGRFTT